MHYITKKWKSSYFLFVNSCKLLCMDAAFMQTGERGRGGYALYFLYLLHIFLATVAFKLL